MTTKTPWQPLMKPAFLQDISFLSGKELALVMEKIRVLTDNPMPDGTKVKAQLVHCQGKPYRIRAGSYRIFYTFKEGYIYIYKLDRRGNDTYGRDCPEAEEVPDIEVLKEMKAPEVVEPPPQTAWTQDYTQSRPLPEPITAELLTNLQIPERYHTDLLQVRDEDALLACSDIPAEALDKVIEYLFPATLQEAMAQPDLVLNEVEDLQRYHEGELLAFLLKLSPEQEKYTKWPLQANGPTLVKGGPGTGKSTVALYRIQSLLRQLLPKESRPRILFTTYTTALVKSSEQLLQQLLGEDAHYVEVKTADRITEDIMRAQGELKEILPTNEQYSLLQQALNETTFTGNLLQQEAQRLTLQRLGKNYLLQEFNEVIIARQVPDVYTYLEMPRTGRKVSLKVAQRIILWRVYERWRDLVLETGKETWQQRRSRAEALMSDLNLPATYDAVIIDEAQDLNPSVLRLLIKLCKSPTRLFLTADANQSIHGSGFTWSEVHAVLQFRGRTNILPTNYRSTREIGEAAQSYLASGALEPDSSEHDYLNSGPRPRVLSVQTSDHEARLLERFFKQEARNLHLPLGACAILCPNAKTGEQIASFLRMLGLEATYMNGQNLDLKYSGIKILELPVAKGLEFPIVALAGFVSALYPLIPTQALENERDEILARERRTLFVGMTRAMRALLVVIPLVGPTALFEGFDPHVWQLNETR